MNKGIIDTLKTTEYEEYVGIQEKAKEVGLENLTDREQIIIEYYMEYMKMSDFELFLIDVKENIKEYLPERYQEAEIDIIPVVKNNDTVLKGLTIKLPEENCTPNIYLEKFFEEVTQGATLESVLTKIAKIREEHSVSNIDVSILTERENIERKIYPKVINAWKNRNYLSNKVYREFCDLAIVYAINVNEVFEADKESGSANVIITKDMAEKLELTEEELYRISFRNAHKNQIYEVKDILEILIESSIGIKEVIEQFGSIENAKKMFGCDEEPQIYVVTNKERLNGAYILADENFEEIIKGKIKTDSFYIIPSSIHELLIVPDKENINPEDLKLMVEEVNENEVSDEDYLSDNIYIIENGKVEIFDSFFS